MEESDTRLYHPRRIPLPKWDKEEPASEVIYYTDGSKIDDKVGEAFVKYQCNKLTKQESTRLTNNSSVFQAEVWGIRMALEDIIKGEITAEICVDSQATLQAVCNPYHNKTHVK